ncbi:MAG: hypothetical protein ABI778_07665 [Ignavibacteriota bacterium]
MNRSIRYIALLCNLLILIGYAGPFFVCEDDVRGERQSCSTNSGCKDSDQSDDTHNTNPDLCQCVCHVLFLQASVQTQFHVPSAVVTTQEQTPTLISSTVDPPLRPPVLS